MDSDPPPPSLLSEGQLLAGKYRILRLLGRGGMAEVYAAHDEILHQTVALKLLLAEVAAIPGAAGRFLNEARSAARIRSEHVASVMDVGMREDGSAYIVLEYLEGEELQALAIRRGPLPVGEAVDYLLQALEALAHAHALGIVHRDLKPSNIFLARAPGGRTLVKVFDFGISKAPRTPEQADESSTASQMILGTPSYMAPEQARNAKEVDPRADIWALGVILYRLLTGALPFAGESPADVLAAILVQSHRPARELRPDLSPEIDAIVSRCLAKDRESRFATVAELASALAPFAGGEARSSVDRISRALGVAVSASAATVVGPRPVPLPSAPHLPPPPMPTVASGPPPKPEPHASATMMDASLGKRAGSLPSRGPAQAYKWVAGAAVALFVAAASIFALRPSHDAPSSPATAKSPELTELSSPSAPPPAPIPDKPPPPAAADVAPTPPDLHAPPDAAIAGLLPVGGAKGAPLAPAGSPPARSPLSRPSEVKGAPTPASSVHSSPRLASSASPSPSAAAKAYDVLDQRN